MVLTQIIVRDDEAIEESDRSPSRRAGAII
jgi:hypothetical protein